MTADDRAARAAKVLARSRLSYSLFDGFSDDLRPEDEAQAYAIQAKLHPLLSAGGLGQIVGHKIGCTTPVMQAYLGIGNPCAGRVFDTTVHTEFGEYEHHGRIRIGVECEIAVRLGQDIAPRSGYTFSAADVRPAVAACMAAIEVVEDRYVDYPSLDTPTLIADDFFNAGAVLGPEHDDFDPAHLVDVTAYMVIDRERVGSGVGSDVLGNPLDALAWLATNASSRGTTLHSGEFVVLGSLVQTHWIASGSIVEVVNEPLGRVGAAFS